MNERTREQLGRMDPETRAKLGTLMTRNDSPEARAGRVAARDVIEAEVRATGGIEAEDGTFHPVRVPGTSPAATEVVGTFRAIREAKGLSLDDLAKTTGLERSAISKLERGETNPTLRTLERYAGGLRMRLVVALIDAPTSA